LALIKVNQSFMSIKVLGIDKGLGNKINYLKDNLNENFHLVTVPEPAEDFNSGISKVTDAIQTIKPDVLIASSRGAKLAIEILQKHIWNGPTLLLSAMTVSEVLLFT
jgi:hypothetical protein